MTVSPARKRIPSPSRLLIAGDTHANIEHKQYLCEVAVDLNCDAIFQVGDWYWWPHTRDGRAFIEATKDLLEEYNLFEWFCDGNHENFDSLWSEPWKITEDGFYELQDRLQYVPRGVRWVWHGVKFMAMGGAVSLDKEVRLRAERRAGLYRHFWWPEEQIRQSDLYRALEPGNGHIDIMFTHDCPYGVRIPHWPDFSMEKPSYHNRLAIRDLIEVVKPKQLYHGHLHHRYTSRLRIPDAGVDCVIDGLNKDDTFERSWTVLDLKEYRQAHGF